MDTRYFNKAENVLFYNPMTRLLAKIFGPNNYIHKCKTCGKIPTEVWGEYCFKHKQ